MTNYYIIISRVHQEKDRIKWIIFEFAVILKDGLERKRPV